MKQKEKKTFKTKSIDRKIKELEIQNQALKKLLDSIGSTTKRRPTHNPKQ